MSLWLDLGRLAAGINVLLLVFLGAVWLRNYLAHRARHTLMLLVFAGFLALENLLWLYVYLLRDDVVGWYLAVGSDLQISLMLLCGLETVALGVMSVLTAR